MSINFLQNGSDIRGTALGTNKSQPANFGPLEAFYIFFGFCTLLKEKKNIREPLTIAVGRDPRLSGPALVHAVSAAARLKNINLINGGISSTPAMFMATKFPEIKADGSIMITASHLPSNRNGMKFFTAQGGLDKEDIFFILEESSKAAAKFPPEKASALMDPAVFDKHSRTHFGYGCSILKKESNSKETALSPLMKLYTTHLREMVIKGLEGSKEPLKDMKIIVDAGNGAGGFFVSEILKPLGADTSGSLFLNPDGNFPNHEPNPENKEAMEIFSKAVKREKADLGLIFDTDVDRSAAVTSQGRPLARNAIVALAAALISEKYPGTTVVTDSITSCELKTFLEKDLDLKHLRFKRGYKNVINKSIELNSKGIDSQLAIETSGHGAYKENYFLDDGAYLAVKILIAATKLKKKGKGIEELISGLKEPSEAFEFRFPIKSSHFRDMGKAILNETEAWVKEKEESGTAIHLETPNYEGVRINFEAEEGNGWCLLRASLHDPLLVLNIESNSPGGSLLISETLKNFLKKFEELDISKL